MKPYSIGHDLILTAKRNPMVVGTRNDFDLLPESAQIAAMTQAVDVCSQTWLQNNTTYLKWSDRCRINNCWKKWEKANRNTDWPLAIADFRNYRAEGSSFPPITDNRFSDASSDAAAGRSAGSPFMARLINYLRQSRIPEADIMDYPLGRATFEYFASLEEVGRIQVENHNENETRLSFERNAAAILREQKLEAQQNATA